MITSRSAEAIGMGGEIGSLAQGRRGDVVIWSGDPLEGSSAAEVVWIDGVRQPLETRQTKLRDRYRDLQRKELARGVSAVSPLALLGLAAFSFVATHFIMSHPLRAGLVGEARRARISWSPTRVVAFATLGWTIWAYGRVPAEAPRYGSRAMRRWLVASLLMWLGSILFIGSLRSNPSFPSAGMRTRMPTPRGVFAITRHPMMWGFALWALVHAIVVRNACRLDPCGGDRFPRSWSGRRCRTPRRRD